MVKSARPVWPVGNDIERVAICFFAGLYVVISKHGEYKEYQKEVAAACKRAARVQSRDELFEGPSMVQVKPSGDGSFRGPSVAATKRVSIHLPPNPHK